MCFKTLSVCFLVYLLSNFSYGQRGKKFFRRGYSYIDATGSFYKIHTTYQTWAGAKQVCAQEGASLFYPDNDNEARAVISFWTRTQPQIKLVNVGLSDIKVEGRFETIDGKQVAEVYNNWQPGEPNNQNGDENCVVLFQNGYINDGTCYTTEAFICKKSLLGNNCFREDYSYIDAAESFYKIHITYQTWADAKQVCDLEGASLFYPDNDDEARAVISFWTRTQPQIGLVNVGLSDIKVEGRFETIDGKQVAEVYNNWQQGEPNNQNGNEDCVVLFQNGYINDGTCHTTEAFICKKSLRSLQRNCNMQNLDRSSFREDYGYIDAARSFYKIHTDYQTWADAKQACAQEGARLFYPDNDNEARAVISFWTRTQPQIRLVNVGLSDIKVEGHFETIDGKQVTEVYNNWQPGEPNNQNGNEDCVVLFQNGYINDGTCHTTEAFICKKNLDGRRPKKFFRADYNYIEAVMSFYKIHSARQEWADAKQTCALEGASLFYPENSDEAHAVLSFWNTTQPHISSVYVGITDIKDEGQFETIDGKPISEVYSNWKSGQPNDAGGNQDCVRLYQQGDMSDIRCETKHHFICKKSLLSLECATSVRVYED